MFDRRIKPAEDIGQDSFTVFLGHHFCDGPADQFIVGITEHGSELVVAVSQHALLGNADALKACFGERDESRLAQARRLNGPGALCDLELQLALLCQCLLAGLMQRVEEGDDGQADDGVGDNPGNFGWCLIARVWRGVTKDQ